MSAELFGSGNGVNGCRDAVGEHIAFHIGATGPAGENFYAELVTRDAERRQGDAAACSDASVVDDLGLVDPRAHAAMQLEPWRDGRSRR
jgi:hypothetical protein